MPTYEYECETCGIHFEKLQRFSEEPLRTCPECHTPLVRPEGEAQHYCPNEHHCPPQITRRIEHFVSRGALDIQGIGEALVKQLVESGMVHDPADLYFLTAEQLAGLERMGKKSAENAVKAIQGAKTPTLARLIFGFGAGFLTVIIRAFGGYPDGVAFSILLMNLCVPLIDAYTRPPVFGEAGKK